jgi:nucleotide-binding universal stress UspA family protein
MVEEFQAEVEVVGVVAPVPVFDAGFMISTTDVELYESREESLRLEIRKQTQAAGEFGQGWPIRVESGVPAPRIVKSAEAMDADYIFMGLGEHKAMDRIFGTETALQVIRLSHIPVLAVPQNAEQLPDSAVLGLDFSPFSRRAVAAAAGLLRAPWEVHLVHVMAGTEFLPTMSDAWLHGYEEELELRLQYLGEQMSVPEGSSVHPHILEGDPAHQILTFAQERDLSLLVAGSHGLSFLGRLLIGSVSTRLVRGARTPVLVVPPDEPTAELFGHTDSTQSIHPWVEQLQVFSEANAGRKTTLELKSAQGPSQECGRGFPLLGVCYDPRRDRVEIMLGRIGTVEGHLTHSIPGPEEVVVTRDSRGRAESLNIRLKDDEVVLRVLRDS